MSKFYSQDNMQIHNDDCMAIMAGYEDNYFDLAVVDPPYGINENSNRINKPKKAAAPKKMYNPSLWEQSKPNKEYFEELKRISKNQIIWGGNYFTDNLKESRVWVIWDKQAQFARQVADVEMAWTSFDGSSKLFSFQWCGMLQGDMKNKESRIHPTQKPVKLYNWIYANYAEEGQKILDTHLGSGSNAIAAHYAKLGEFVGCELDEDYFKASIERIRKETRQLELF